MALLFNIQKSSFNLLKSKQLTFCKKCISTTPWFYQIPSDSFRIKEKRLLQKDKISENYKLIYKAPMESYVAWAMHISTLTASLISASAVYQYANNEPLLDPAIGSLTLESEDIYYFAAGFLVINVILRLVVSMFPLRIYKDKENYLAVYHGQLPLLNSHHHFKRGQVKSVQYICNPWNNATYKLGEKPSLLLEECFKTPSEFNQIRGDIDIMK